MAGRICPIDGHILIEDRLHPFDKDVIVDACALCDGMYLDKGELLTLTGNVDLHRQLTRAPVDRDSERKCPGCGAVMDVENAEGTLVDVCMDCRGVWLDNAELDDLQAIQDRAGLLARVFASFR